MCTVIPPQLGDCRACTGKLGDIILKDSQSFLGGAVSFITKLTAAKQQSSLVLLRDHSEQVVAFI